MMEEFQSAAGSAVRRLAGVGAWTASLLMLAGLLLLTAVPVLAADVQISQMNDSPDPAVRGGLITYTLNIENNAADTATGVVLSFPLPASTTFSSVSGTGCAHDGGSPGTVTCSLGNMLGTIIGGSTSTVTVAIRSSASTGATVSASASVTADSDTNLSNNTAAQITTIDNGADLSLTQSVSPASVVAGGNVTWTLTVTNNGPNDAQTITVTDTLPTNMTYQSATGSGWSCSNSGQTVTCTAAALANGASAPVIAIVGKVTGAVTGTLTNTATVNAATSDPDPNNTTTANVTVTAGSDLSITKTVSPNPALSGQTATFTLTPVNNGPFSAATVTVTDTLPAGFSYVSASGSGWSCSESGGTVSCSRASYASGSSNAISIVTTAPVVTALTAASNSAGITSATADPASSNNTTTLNFNVAPNGSDLALTKSKSPNPVAQNSNMTSTLTVHNNGPQTAAAGTVTVTDTLDPALESYVGFSGTNWSCSYVSPTVTCSYAAAIANGANASALTITTQALGTGAISNSAVVSSSATPGDWNNTNNSASASVASTLSNLSADLAITKTASAGGDSTLSNSETDINYTLVVTNNGPGDASGIVISDTINGHLAGTGKAVGTIVNSGSSDAVFSCSTGATITCSQATGTLKAGDSVTVPITVSRPMLDGVRTNFATVTSTLLGDPDRTNNTSNTTSITVDPIADVQMQSKTVTPATVKAGVNATYVMTFRNNGPSSAQGVTVTDTITVPGGDNGFTLISFTPSQGSCGGMLAGNSYAAGTHTLSCNIGSMTSGQSETVTMVIRPNWQSGTTPRTITNTASISTTTWENTSNTDNGNNSQNATLTIDPADLDLLVNNSDSSPAGPDPLGYDPVTPSNNIIVYTIALTNRGPSVATGVTFTDSMTPPAGKRITFIGSGTTAATASSNNANICNNVGLTSSAGSSITITCNLGSSVVLASGVTETRYLAFRVEDAPATGGDTYSNSATVASSETDNNLSNNTEGETTTVRVRSDLAVTKTASAATVQIRQPFYWTIIVSNGGPGDSQQTTLTDTMPSGMSFFTAAQSSSALAPYNAAPYNAGPVWTNNNASPASGICSTSGQVLSCNFGLLESGRSVTLTVPVRITSYAASYANSATVSTSEVDPVSANNSATGTVLVTQSSLTGFVYRDLNNNATKDSGETGVNSVNLRLTGTDDYGNSVNTTVGTGTGGSGAFTFSTLSPSTVGVGGGYTITETAQPSGYWNGRETAGNAGGTVPANSHTTDYISEISLAANTAASGYLFGELPQNSISGYVYVDANNNGVKDSGESVITNVTVQISGTSYGPDGVEGTADDVTSMSGITFTNSLGQYTFTPLYAGNYKVTVPQPAAYLDGKDTIGTISGSACSSCSTAVNDSISGITLSSFGLSATNMIFGELAPATISGTVYIDQNTNAVKDSGETGGVPGVTITLTGTNDLGQPVSMTTTTDSSGNYSFTGLRPGSYSVSETPPASLTHTGAQAGTAGGTGGGSSVTSVTGITLASGTTASGYNFGESGRGLSGYVYVDLNSNGIKDASEPGIPGVQITLSGTTSTGGDVCSAYSGFSCTVTTGSDGGYSFVNLPASNALGYALTEQLQTSAPLSNYLDGAESVGSLGGNVGNDQISGIVLGISSFGAGYNFGERGSSVAGRVYLDLNDDGIFAGGTDLGLPGVALTISGQTASGADVCTILPSCTVTTIPDGSYTFSGLPAGNYTITETQPADYASRTTTAGSSGGSVTGTAISSIPVTAGSTLTGYLFGEKTGSISGSVYHDTNNDGVKQGSENGVGGVTLRITGTSASGLAVSATTTTSADGSYSFTALLNASAGGYTITETQPAGYLDGKATAGTVNGAACSGCVATVDNLISAIPFDASKTFAGFNFGELQAASIAGRVYHDANSNGAYDAGEELAGVELKLSGLDDKGAVVLQTVTTAADGSYSFTNLRPSDAGGYTVTETQPNGIADLTGNSGSQVGTVNGVVTGGAVPGTHNVITGIIIGSGNSGLNYNFRENASLLSGYVYLDDNSSGSKEGSEAGIAGVTITLTGTNVNNLSVNRSTTTSSDGSYSFIGLTSGSYNLTETQPVIYADGRETAGISGTVDNGSFTNAAEQNRISAIALPAGTASTGNLFGEQTGLPGSFSGKVWYNSQTHDQTQQSGEPGLAGWIVEVVRGGVVRGSTVTATDGSWSIGSLPAATGYEIRFRHPTNRAVYGIPVSQDGNYSDSIPNYSALTIANMTLRSGGNVVSQNLPVDPSGIVYDSITRAAVSGATVSISGPAGFDAASHLLGGTTSQSQITDASGFYQFLLLPGAPAGTYTLTVNGPANYVPGISTIIPAATGPLNPGAGPGFYQVQSQSSPPTGAMATTYYLTFTLSGSAANVINNHLPIDPILGGAILVTKATPKVNVPRGDLVPYTIQARNTLAATLSGIDLVDEIPAGFKYVSGSARLNGFAVEPAVSGRTLRWPNLTFTASESKSLTLVLVVGSGVGDGEYTNRAWAYNSLAAATVSNVARATVRVTPDPTFDCSDIIGKVFDDRNLNGYQDSGEPGIANVRVATAKGWLVTTDAEGRFHVACAMIPQMDRGSNFIMKLDERTLPSGYRMTTENPRTVRATRGKLVKLNFGAAIHRVVRVEFSAAAFSGKDGALDAQWQKQLDDLPDKLLKQPTVVRLAYRYQKGVQREAQQRVDAIAGQLRKRWEKLGNRYPLSIETELVEVEK